MAAELNNSGLDSIKLASDEKLTWRGNWGLQNLATCTYDQLLRGDSTFPVIASIYLYLQVLNPLYSNYIEVEFNDTHQSSAGEVTFISRRRNQ